LAPGGKDALLMAVDMATGKVLWRTPNPKGWKMTHSSVMRMDLAGEPTYVYSASHGVVGVSARDGKLLWDTTEWKISIANVPSPVQLGDGRLFFSGGYNAGSCLLQVSADHGQWSVKTQYRLLPEVFGATQHTPILHREHLFGVRPDGQFVCLNQAGKVVWASGLKVTFGLGPFLLANDLFYVLSENGLLSLVEATPEKFNLLAQAQVLHGHEAWGPMALAGTKLVVRDFNHLACLEVGDAKP
jgi:outer membrane protein assembly factor BamB